MYLSMDGDRHLLTGDPFDRCLMWFRRESVTNELELAFIICTSYDFFVRKILLKVKVDFSLKFT